MQFDPRKLLKFLPLVCLVFASYAFENFKLLQENQSLPNVKILKKSRRARFRKRIKLENSYDLLHTQATNIDDLLRQNTSTEPGKVSTLFDIWDWHCNWIDELVKGLTARVSQAGVCLFESQISVLFQGYYFSQFREKFQDFSLPISWPLCAENSCNSETLWSLMIRKNQFSILVTAIESGLLKMKFIIRLTNFLRKRMRNFDLIKYIRHPEIR